MSVVYPANLVWVNRSEGASEPVEQQVNNIDICNGNLGDVTFKFDLRGSDNETRSYLEFDLYTDVTYNVSVFVKAEIINYSNITQTLLDYFLNFKLIIGIAGSNLSSSDDITLDNINGFSHNRVITNVSVDTTQTKEICGQTLYLLHKYNTNKTRVGFYIKYVDYKYDDYIRYILENPVEIDLRITVKII